MSLSQCHHEEDNSWTSRNGSPTGNVILDKDEIGELLSRAYSVLNFTAFQGRGTPQGQQILSDLRDAIAEITQTSAQSVQNLAGIPPHWMLTSKDYAPPSL